MSELREEILGAGINKKRLIGVALVAALLVAMFAYSVVFISFLFGSRRPLPSENYDDTPFEPADLVVPPLPLDILTELLDFFLNNPDELLKLASLIDPDDFADVLSDMIDADIDDFDIGNFSQALLPLLGAAGALLLSEREVFRVYDYDSVFDIQNNLWKLECFDEFNEYEWLSTAATAVTSFTTLSDYYSHYSSEDILELKIPISPENPGQFSMVIPSLFPYPHIMEDTVSSPNLDPSSPILIKDDFNSSIINLNYNAGGSVNLTYDLFGESLPTEQDITASAVIVTNPSPEYLNISTQFTQLPPTINDYINSHPFFESHYNNLKLIIDPVNDNDYDIANKIKSYLQNNFIFGWDAVLNDPPGDTEDVVEWFCEKGEGLFAEFASAFVVFARAFNVSSRFVDGYRTQFNGQVDEVYDNIEGKNAVQIKYKHLYNWAEVYIPTDITGRGNWIQFDIDPEQSGQGQFDLNLNSNFTAGFRGEVANLTAILSSPTGASIVNRTISFVDVTYGMTVIGQELTDQNGQATFLLNINNSQVVGPHVIAASFYNLASDNASYIVYGNINVNLTSVNPPIINRSISNSTFIQGNVFDPNAKQGVDFATVEFLLFDSGTNNKIANPFDIIYTNTDSAGNFDTVINVDPSVLKGGYDVRVDFNGSWGGIPLAFGIMSNSSSRIPINVTEEGLFTLLFSINGTPTDYPFSPIIGNLINVNRFQDLNLSVTLIDTVTKLPVSGEVVEFYDYSNGNVLIGTDVTNSFGNASFLYNIGPTNKSGPTLVYAKVGINKNYSYYIVNEPIWINIISFSDPLEVDLAGVGPSQFNIQCNLIDAFANPISFSPLILRMNRSFTDYTGFLIPGIPVTPVTPGSNFYNFNRGVLASTPINNYTLRLEFSGIFDFSSYPYAATFNLPAFNNTIEVPRQVRIYDNNDIQIYFYIEGNPTRVFYDNFNPPQKYNPGDTANFTVNVVHGGTNPAFGTNITIWDEFTNTLLDTHVFLGGYGYWEFYISTFSFDSGIHKIRVQFEDFPTINTTFIIINKSVNFNLNPIPGKIIRNSDSLTVSGDVFDSGIGLRGLRVSLQLLNNTGGNVSQYLIGSSVDFTAPNGYFQFDISSISIGCPQGSYFVRVDFNGSIFLPGIPGINFIPNFMINTSSSLFQLNITAGTNLNQDGFHTKSGLNPSQWINDDVLYVYGSLNWDNGTALANMVINVTIKLLDSTVVD
ncbi:MAG: transglutaminase-like domain-containing protein, partial [Promethearchaeota archaeon]